VVVHKCSCLTSPHRSSRAKTCPSSGFNVSPLSSMQTAATTLTRLASIPAETRSARWHTKTTATTPNSTRTTPTLNNLIPEAIKRASGSTKQLAFHSIMRQDTASHRITRQTMIPTPPIRPTTSVNPNTQKKITLHRTYRQLDHCAQKKIMMLLDTRPRIISRRPWKTEMITFPRTTTPRIWTRRAMMVRIWIQVLNRYIITVKERETRKIDITIPQVQSTMPHLQSNKTPPTAP
jgi:hypothetical protein